MDFTHLMNWIMNNINIIGLVVAILTFIATVIGVFKSQTNKKIKQIQTSKENSLNIQIGGDYNTRKD